MAYPSPITVPKATDILPLGPAAGAGSIVFGSICKYGKLGLKVHEIPAFPPSRNLTYGRTIVLENRQLMLIYGPSNFGGHCSAASSITRVNKA